MSSIYSLLLAAVPSTLHRDRGVRTYGRGTTLLNSGASGDGRAGEEEGGEDGELHCDGLEESRVDLFRGLRDELLLIDSGRDEGGYL